MKLLFRLLCISAAFVVTFQLVGCTPQPVVQCDRTHRTETKTDDCVQPQPTVIHRVRTNPVIIYESGGPDPVVINRKPSGYVSGGSSNYTAPAIKSSEGGTATLTKPPVVTSPVKTAPLRSTASFKAPSVSRSTHPSGVSRGVSISGRSSFSG